MDTLLFSAPVVIGLVLAVAVVAGPFALYRLTRNWSDTSRAAIIMWLVAVGAVLNVALQPRNLTHGEDSASIAASNFMQNETYANWASRGTSAALVGFALATLLAFWLSREKKVKTDPVRVLAVVLCLYYFLTILTGATLAGAPTFDQKSLYSPIVLAALLSLRGLDVPALMRHVKLMLAGALALGLVVALVFPEFALLRPYAGQIPGIDFRLYGVASHANALGPLGLLLLLLELSYPSRAILRWPFLLIALINFALAQSKTVWMAALIVVAVVYIPYRFMVAKSRPDGHASTIKLILLLIAGMVGVIVALMNVDLTQRVSGGVLTLTGRTDIWADTIAEFERYPIFGYGPGLWGVEYRIQMGKLYAGQAHNQFIHTLGESGLVGFLLLVAYVGVLLRLALMSFRASKGLSLTLYTLIFIRCITEAPLRGVVNDWTFFMHAILLIVLAGYARISHTEERQEVAVGPNKLGRGTKFQRVNGQ